MGSCRPEFHKGNRPGVPARVGASIPARRAGWHRHPRFDAKAGRSV